MADLSSRSVAGFSHAEPQTLHFDGAPLTPLAPAPKPETPRRGDGQDEYGRDDDDVRGFGAGGPAPRRQAAAADGAADGAVDGATDSAAESAAACTVKRRFSVRAVDGTLERDAEKVAAAGNVRARVDFPAHGNVFERCLQPSGNEERRPPSDEERRRAVAWTRDSLAHAGASSLRGPDGSRQGGRPAPSVDDDDASTASSSTAASSARHAADPAADRRASPRGDGENGASAAQQHLFDGDDAEDDSFDDGTFDGDARRGVSDDDTFDSGADARVAVAADARDAGAPPPPGHLPQAPPGARRVDDFGSTVAKMAHEAAQKLAASPHERVRALRMRLQDLERAAARTCDGDVSELAELAAACETLIQVDAVVQHAPLYVLAPPRGAALASAAEAGDAAVAPDVARLRRERDVHLRQIRVLIVLNGRLNEALEEAKSTQWVASKWSKLCAILCRLLRRTHAKVTLRLAFTLLAGAPLPPPRRRPVATSPAAEQPLCEATPTAGAAGLALQPVDFEAAAADLLAIKRARLFDERRESGGAGDFSPRRPLAGASGSDDDARAARGAASTPVPVADAAAPATWSQRWHLEERCHLEDARSDLAASFGGAYDDAPSERAWADQATSPLAVAARTESQHAATSPRGGPALRDSATSPRAAVAVAFAATSPRRAEARSVATSPRNAPRLSAEARLLRGIIRGLCKVWLRVAFCAIRNAAWRRVCVARSLRRVCGAFAKRRMRRGFANLAERWRRAVEDQVRNLRRRQQRLEADSETRDGLRREADGVLKRLRRAAVLHNLFVVAARCATRFAFRTITRRGRERRRRNEKFRSCAAAARTRLVRCALEKAFAALRLCGEAAKRRGDAVRKRTAACLRLADALRRCGALSLARRFRHWRLSTVARLRHALLAAAWTRVAARADRRRFRRCFDSLRRRRAATRDLRLVAAALAAAASAWARRSARRAFVALALRRLRALAVCAVAARAEARRRAACFHDLARQASRRSAVSRAARRLATHLAKAKLASALRTLRRACQASRAWQAALLKLGRARLRFAMKTACRNWLRQTLAQRAFARLACTLAAVQGRRSMRLQRGALGKLKSHAARRRRVLDGIVRLCRWLDSRRWKALCLYFARFRLACTPRRVAVAAAQGRCVASALRSAAQRRPRRLLRRAFSAIAAHQRRAAIAAAAQAEAAAGSARLVAARRCAAFAVAAWASLAFSAAKARSLTRAFVRWTAFIRAASRGDEVARRLSAAVLELREASTPARLDAARLDDGAARPRNAVSTDFQSRLLRRRAGTPHERHKNGLFNLDAAAAILRAQTAIVVCKLEA